jgi:diguanylate cyclase
VLDALRELGVRLSIDDFGTGYSSMSYLRTLPIHELKIDRSFITNMREQAGDEAIVRAVLELSRNLGLHVVAEGVEDQPTWAALAALGCPTVQGYHLSRPIPEAEVPGWVARHQDGEQIRGATTEFPPVRAS